METTKIIIDPRSSFQYGSFYVKALYDKFGARAISFSLKPFSQLPDLGNNMRFVVICEGRETKYFIHTDDTFHLQMDDYDWCDVYGSVNANFLHYPAEDYPKLISLCPSFAIKPDNMLFAIGKAISCFAQSYEAIATRQKWNPEQNRFIVNKKTNIRNYWSRVYKGISHRPNYYNYLPQASSDNYIFFLSTLWYSDDQNKNDDGVNLRRARFIRACKSVAESNGFTFEGGFANRSSSHSASVFADCMSNEVSMAEWMEKNHRSAIVFNTPAFWDCHGWKLGEYLAMGKCIISTPLSNSLPAPLLHGVHIHYVENDEEAMKEAIDYILSHPEYKRKLELGAQAYWKEYGSPEATLRLLGIGMENGCTIF